MNWPAPPLPAGYPWPVPPHMPGMPPVGVRPPMMFGPPPGGFPPGSFQPPPRLPFSAPPDTAGEEIKEMKSDGEIGKQEGSGGGGDNGMEDSLQRETDNTADVPFMPNFPRPPMGCGDWRMRAPMPFMGMPNMPRPDMMRGPPSLLGEIPGPRGLLRAPPAPFSMAQNLPNPEEDDNEEYYDEYGDDEGNGEEEEYDEEYDEEYNEEYDEEYNEEYNEEGEEFPFDGNDHFICLSLASHLQCFDAVCWSTGMASGL